MPFPSSDSLEPSSLKSVLRISVLPVFFLLFWGHPAATLRADIIQFSAEKVSSTAAEGREHTRLEGNVAVDVNNSSIETEALDIYGKDRDILVAKKNVLIDNREQKLEIQGRELFYNRRTKLLRMRSSVNLEDKENEVIVYCDFIEYNEDTDTAKIQVNVRIFSEDITARSEYAFYNRKTQIVELSGAPIVHKDEDVYQAARIFVNLDTKDITLDNGVEGQIITKDE
ncbi:OstA-like protein [Candidatus Haliotispira prima]|uniref:OstA-like protein n=1 Tax=Candidatus Haliotispira prima TaxID=3034016 RepID=A0ABY8MGZ2_9SPIO|nr:OstA-like protein [Candidatus Haliotispira prima]